MKIFASQQNILLDKSVKLLKGHTVPKSFGSYDYQKMVNDDGITRELYQFKDTFGKIIKEVENIINENILKEVRVTAYETHKNADIKRVFVKDVNTGKISYTKEESFPMEQGKMTYIESVAQGKADEHKIRFVSDGMPEREISYTTNWDGKKPKLHYKNIKGKLPKEGLEYLPLIVSEGSTKRINHIAQVQIDSQGIGKYIGLPYIVPFKLLNPDITIKEAKTTRVPVHNARALYDKVEMHCYVKKNERLIDLLSHEYQHIADRVGMSRIISKKNFNLVMRFIMSSMGCSIYKHTPFLYRRMELAKFKILKKGIILPFSKKDSEYRKLENDLILYRRKCRAIKDYEIDEYKLYLERPSEIRAFDKGREELSKFYMQLLRIKELLTKP